MGAIGRRAGFQVGTAFGMFGAAVCALAVFLANFWLLCAGMGVMGMFTAFGKYYRFAAADAAEVEFRAKAISLTLAGGIAGGIFGPEMAKRTAGLYADHAYLGSYLSLIFVCLAAAVLLMWLDIPKLSEHERKDSGRPLGVIMRQPVFIVAALAGTGLLNFWAALFLLGVGWNAVNYGSIPFLLLAAAATFWLMWCRRRGGETSSPAVADPLVGDK
jgi:hypothetical protein